MSSESTDSQFPLSVMILTRNESSNIAACLSHFMWADDVILIDSNSTDDTPSAAVAARPDIRVFQNSFEDFGQQRNWALDNTQPRHEWILFIDADERVNESCAEAIRQTVSNPGDRVGFFLCYRNIFLGRWIRHCTQFPSWQLRLLRHGKVRYQKEGHGQREILDGPAGYVDAPYDHLDLSKGLFEWIARHNRYSTEEAELVERLRDEPLALGNLLGAPIERRRCLKRIAARLGGSPVAWFCYLYFLRLGFLDGRPGYIYCLLRAAQQIHIKAKLAEKALG
jgi:glycosyltransferase involved in cell wall biosynthesis